MCKQSWGYKWGDLTKTSKLHYFCQQPGKAYKKEVKPIYQPWSCSLQTTLGVHRCGVTLLSAPPSKTVLVGAAQCNSVCKDNLGAVKEMCCCRTADTPGSCATSTDTCSGTPTLQVALPSELQIVCGESSSLSPSTPVVLPITSIINHPSYSTANGPIDGNDIAVYIVDDANLVTSMDTVGTKPVYPACLPKETYSNTESFISGWRNPLPASTLAEATELTMDQYKKQYILPGLFNMVSTTCADPTWMSSSTFYPAGVLCYQDPSADTCLEFGMSGSGVMRKFGETSGGLEQVSWVGPLSMHKGCHRTLFPAGQPVTDYSLNLAGENVGVITDGYCFLPWIAEQYGLQMPTSFNEKSCDTTIGSSTDKDKTSCNAAQGATIGTCDFSYVKTDGEVASQCELLATDGYSSNTFTCYDPDGQLQTCANNCKGVNPQYIVAGGEATVVASVTATNTEYVYQTIEVEAATTAAAATATTSPAIGTAELAGAGFVGTIGGFAVGIAAAPVVGPAIAGFFTP